MGAAKWSTSRAQARFRVGPGGWVYLLVSLSIAGVALYTQANLLFWAVGLLVAALVTSVLASWWMLRGLSVERIVPEHGVAGEAMTLRYQVGNAKRWMPALNLVVAECWDQPRPWWRGRRSDSAQPDDPCGGAIPCLKGRPHGWILHLGPRQSVQAEAPCWPLRRGQLRFAAIEIYSFFPFGIVSRVVRISQPGMVLVYPHLHRIKRRLLAHLSSLDPGGSRRLERGGGADEFFGLRAYRPGDNLRMIDWKRTAKMEQMISREMTQASPPQIMLALDLKTQPRIPPRRIDEADLDGPCQLDPEAVERAVSLAASVICEAHFQGYRVGLIVLGAACPAFPIHRSLPHRTRMLEALSRLERTEEGAAGAIPGVVPGAGTARPSVVVRVGPSDAGREQRGWTVLGTQGMDQYLAESVGGSEAVLSARPPRQALPRRGREGRR